MEKLRGLKLHDCSGESPSSHLGLLRTLERRVRDASGKWMDNELGCRGLCLLSPARAVPV